MPSSRRPGENIDAALDAATPILDILETALDLAPVPGLGLIPKALSAVVDRVKVRSIVHPHPRTTSISAEFSISHQVARANKESRNAFVAQVTALSVVINGTNAKAKDTLASYHGHKDDQKKVVGRIIHSKELQEGAKELLRCASASIVQAPHKLKAIKHDP